MVALKGFGMILIACLPIIAGEEALDLTPLIAEVCKLPQCKECVKKMIEKILAGQVFAEKSKTVDVAQQEMKGKSGKSCPGLNAPLVDLVKLMVADNYKPGDDLSKHGVVKRGKLCKLYQNC